MSRTARPWKGAGCLMLGGALLSGVSAWGADELPLSKQLTLVFATNVNQSAEQLIQVQYQVTENTQLVATRDETGVFSIVYRIRKRYR